MKRILVAAAATLLLSAGTADAATTTANLNVSANVINACSFSAGAFNLGFGTYDPAAVKTASATVSFTCTKTAIPVFSMNNGANASGAQKRMVSTTVLPAEFINYAVATNAVVGSPGALQSIVLDGTIGAGQWVSADAYADTVVLTVTF